MKKRKSIGITSDSICDLPLGLQEAHDINVVYYYVENSNGRFRDMDEVTAENVLEYMEGGEKRIQLDAPSITDYKNFFKKHLARFEDIIHLSGASLETKGYERAIEAVKELGEHGKRVHVVDTSSISGAMSLLALNLQSMIDADQSLTSVLKYIEESKANYKLSLFISDPYFLLLSKRISKFKYTLMTFFQIHPVIEMKEGKVKFKTFLIGNQEKAMDRFIKKAFPSKAKIDNRRVFISYCDTPVKRMEYAKQEIMDRYDVKDIIINKMSATIASCLGNYSLGIFYLTE